jgi:hypothetical protein
VSWPDGVAQALTVIIFVIPGAVFQNWRSRLRGPTPDQVEASSRMLRAIAVSAVLLLAYGLLIGERLVANFGSAELVRADARKAAFWGMLLLFVIPTLLALAEHAWTVIRRGELSLRHPIRTRGALVTYDPVPTVWDYTSKQLEPCFVRVLTEEGRWIGGWVGDGTFMSSYPESRELYLSDQWRMSETGAFLERVVGSKGVWIRCDDARAVEFVAAPEQDAEMGRR